MDLNTELEALFASLSGDSINKTAQPVADSNDDVAELLEAAGQVLAHSFVDRALEKIAAAVPAAGGGSENPIASPRSAWEQVAARLAQLHGRKLPVGDDTSIRAEDNVGSGAGHMRGKAGATGVANHATPLG